MTRCARCGVCCRRLRSILQAYRTVLDRARTAELVKQLRWLGEVLGGARDLEVLQARFAEAACQVDVDGERVARDLERYFAARQAQAFSDVLVTLDGDRYLQLLAALDALLVTPPLTGKAWRPARVILVDALVRSARRKAEHLHAAASADKPGTRDTELHEARKAAKRLRYAAEVAVPVLGSRAARLASAAHGVQDVLGGTPQDAIAAHSVWREIAVGSAGREAFGYGVLSEREAAMIRAAEEALPSAWRDTRRRLAKVAHSR